MMQLRYYQQEAVNACYQYLRENDGNPAIVCPTGAGKSIIIAQICNDAVTLWNGRVLILAHVKELLEQNANKVKAYLGDDLVGVYSAGLNQRQKRSPVTVAGIQSVYKRACEFEPFDLIIIDEAHMLAPSGEGMYRTFLNECQVINPHLRIIGTTATPYRTSTGTICAPENILNEICYEIGIKELIAQGFLCPLRSKASKYKIDTSGLHIRGGEFVASEIEALMDTDNMVFSACREIIEQTKDRKSVLVFAAGVEHGLHIQHTFEARHNLECGFICGETLPFERADVLERFRSGKLKYLCNVNVLTTGFDAPNIDCVALVRPTNSPGLYSQMIGRGCRIHPQKEDCLILDFGGNIMRHGPVDAIRIKDKSNSQQKNDSPIKECPRCHEVIHAAYGQCPQCQFIFETERKISHDKQASTASVLSSEVLLSEHDVLGTIYNYHVKRNAKSTDLPTMRVDYKLGLNDYQSEWICFEHTGFARLKAENWWKARSNEPVPNTVQQAIDLAEQGVLATTERITIQTASGESFSRIIKHQLGPKPSLQNADVFESSWGQEEIPF